MKQFNIILTAFLLVAQGVFAVVLPGTPDRFWYNGRYSHNTAMISYGPSYTDVLYVSAWNDPGIANGIYVSDGNFSGTVPAAPPVAAMTIGPGTPDVIIGHDPTSPTNRFVVAVAVTQFAWTVRIDFYNVTIVPSSAPTVAYNSSITVLGGGVHPTTVHMDVIAEPYQWTSTPFAFTFCNKFVITWDAAGGNIYAAIGDVGSMSVAPAVFVGNGTEPDVSAIQRNMAGSGAPPVVHDFALLTWIDASGNLVSGEVDFTPASPIVSAPVILETLSASTSLLVHPRIDAIDNYIMNSSPSVTPCHIVANAFDAVTGKWTVRSYSGSGGLWTVSGITDPAGVYDHTMPVVATTVFNTSAIVHYTIAHFTDYTPGSAQAIFMEPIDVTAPVGLSTFPPFSDYFWVNSATGATADMLYYDPNYFTGSLALCAPENLIFPTGTPLPGWYDPPTLVSWSQNIPSGGWRTFFKLASCSLGFRQNPSSLNTVNDEQHCSIHPNPASNVITITNTSLEKNAATRYCIMDMSGRVVNDGRMDHNVHVDVSKFASGSYIIKMFRENTPMGDMKFVKQ